MTPVALALSRVIKQYQNSPLFLAYLEALIAPWQNVEDALRQVELITDIDLSEGAQLDVLGDLVGIKRTVPNGALVGLSLVDVIATDEEYRVLIKARSFKNNSKGNPEDIITALKLLFPSALFIFEDIGGMQISVIFFSPVTPFMRALIKNLDLLPRAAGVGLNLYAVDSPLVFGFEGYLSTGTFGEEGLPLIGAPFLEEII